MLLYDFKSGELSDCGWQCNAGVFLDEVEDHVNVDHFIAGFIVLRPLDFGGEGGVVPVVVGVADQLQQFEPVCEVFSLGGLYAHPAQALAGCYRQHALNSNYSNSQLADTPTYTLQTMSPMKGKVNVVMIDVLGIEY